MTFLYPFFTMFFRAVFEAPRKPVRRVSVLIACCLTVIGCSGDSPETATSDPSEAVVAQVPDMPAGLSFREQVEWHIQYDQYEQAFAVVRLADPQAGETRELLLATHMTYALHLTYGSLTDMRTRMPEALRHFRRVVQMDPGNERALAEIRQIEGIYQSLNRDIPQGIAE